MTNFKIDKDIKPPITSSMFIELERSMVVGDSIVLSRNQAHRLTRAIKNASHNCTTTRQKGGDVRVWKLDKLPAKNQ